MVKTSTYYLIDIGGYNKLNTDVRPWTLVNGLNKLN